MKQVNIFFWGLVVLMPMGVFGQGSRSSTVLFEKDKYFLTEKSKGILDSLVVDLLGIEILTFQLAGHTDSDASDEYNLTLSKNRVETVRNYLQMKGVNLEKAQIDFEGERKPVAPNENSQGMEKNRRVDVLVTFAPPAEIVIVPEPVKDCTKDTLIRLSKGSLVKINVCDFENNADCFKIKEIMNPADAQVAGVETIDDKGNLLISGGMFEYDICAGVKVELYAETPCDDFAGPMDLWELNDQGTWTKVSSAPLVPVSYNGVCYYQFYLRNGGFCNLDQWAPKNELDWITFKAKRGIQLEKVVLSSDSPFWRTSGVPLDVKKRKITMRILCGTDMQVEIYAKNKNQDSLKFEVKPLTRLKGVGRKSRCGYANSRNPLFKRSAKSGVKKYKIRKEDFEPTQAN